MCVIFCRRGFSTQPPSFFSGPCSILILCLRFCSRFRGKTYEKIVRLRPKMARERLKKIPHFAQIVNPRYNPRKILTSLFYRMTIEELLHHLEQNTQLTVLNSPFFYTGKARV